MPGNDPDLRFWTREQMLDHVRTGAAARRRRRLQVTVTGLCALAVLAVTGVVALAHDPERGATVAATTPGPPVTAAPSTVSPATTEAAPPTTVPEPTTITTVRAAPTTTTPPAPATTTTALVCRNSHDPACGEFHYDPIPGNQPMTVEVSVTQVGGPTSRTFAFHVIATDPDAQPQKCAYADYGDANVYPCPVESSICSAPFPPEFGPWTPPDPDPGRYETDLTHTFTSPGTYQVEFRVVSSPALCTAFYGSNAKKQVPVVVP